MSSILPEVRRNISLRTDIDNIRSRYIEKDHETGIQAEFPAFDFYVLKKNLFYLLSRSERVDFKPRWYMRPDYVSYDYYHTVVFWPVILYVNGVHTIEDFKGFAKIFVPTYNVLLEILKDRVPQSILTEEISTEPTLPYSLELYKSEALDEKEIQAIIAKREIETTPPPPEIITKPPEESIIVPSDEEEVVEAIIDGGVY